MAIKASIRNFNDIKNVMNANMSNIDTVNVSMKLNHISKMLEDSVLKFTERYLIVTTELEEMKREFISNSSLINEYLTLTKKEIRFDNFNQYFPGKPNLNVPYCPGYEQKCLMRSASKNLNRQHSSKTKNNSLATTNSKKISNVMMNSSCSNFNKNSVSPDSKKLKSKHINKEDSKSNLNSNNVTEGQKTPLKTRYQNPIIGNSNNNNNNNVNSNAYSNNNTNNNNNSNSNTNTNSVNVPTKTKLTRKILHDSNLIVSSNLHKQAFIKKTSSMSTTDKQAYHNKVVSYLKNPKTKALYILINKTNLLSFQEQITTIYLNKEQLSLNLPSNILNEKLSQLTNIITKHELNEKPLTTSEKELVEKLTAFPSSHSEKGLNVLSKERENELINNNTQVENELTKMIFTCLNKQNEIEGYATNANAYNYLFRYYGVNSIKSLLRDVVYKNVYCELKCDNVNDVIDVIEGNKDFMAEILTNGTNKNFSYVANALQDICEFLTEAKEYLNNKNNNSNVKSEVKRINKLKYYYRVIEDVKELL